MLGYPLSWYVFFSIFIKDERIGSGTGKRSGAFVPTEDAIPEKDLDENRQKTTTTKKTSGKRNS